MKNSYLPEGILKAMETLAEATRPYQAAVDAIKQNTELFAALNDPLGSKFGVMDGALTRGLFAESLAQSVSGLLAPYHEFAGAQAAITALGSSFARLLKPEVYASVNAMASTMTKLTQPVGYYQAIRAALEPMIRESEIVDTTWLKNSSAWLVDKSVLSGLDVGNLLGLSSAFSRLCALEHETSILARIPETFTSAASQIASITTALEIEIPIGWKYDDLLSATTLISDYCSLATRQHELLQKASKPDEVSWRLGVLDAASKFVDRQFSWYLGFTEAISNEEIADSEEDLDETESTALSLIPTHVGYTRRVDKTPTEGLEESVIVSLTEKGKRIAQYGLTTTVVPVTTAEYGLSVAARPYNSRLDKSKLVEAGFKPLPTWQDAVSRYLKEAQL